MNITKILMERETGRKGWQRKLYKWKFEMQENFILNDQWSSVLMKDSYWKICANNSCNKFIKVSDAHGRNWSLCFCSNNCFDNWLN